MITEKLRPLHEKMKTHLLTQNEKSLGDNGWTCMYRGPNGLMCAAGILIPDDEYYDGMEEMAARDLSFFNENFTIDELELIGIYQTIHDEFSETEWSGRIELLETLGVEQYLNENDEDDY